MGAPASAVGSGADEVRELFAGSLVGPPAGEARGKGLPVSFVLHVVVLSAIVAVPLLTPVELPPVEQGIVVSLSDLAPPPPPPLQLGTNRPQTHEPKATAIEEPKTVEKPREVPPLTLPREPEIQPEQKVAAADQAGDPDGVTIGDPMGMAGGVEGGVVGGVEGGQLGGVLGGTGTIVQNYDRPPRPIYTPKPVPPAEAMIRNVQGTVVVEIVIGTDGKVVSARVIQPIPLLNDAAIRCVYQWVFSPAMKDGRPVMAIAHGEVKFRIL